MADGALHDYHLAHSARAELLRRMGRLDAAGDAFAAALALARQEPTRRFLRRRLAEVRADGRIGHGLFAATQPRCPPACKHGLQALQRHLPVKIRPRH